MITEALLNKYSNPRIPEQKLSEPCPIRHHFLCHAQAFPGTASLGSGVCPPLLPSLVQGWQLRPVGSQHSESLARKGNCSAFYTVAPKQRSQAFDKLLCQVPLL